MKHVVCTVTSDLVFDQRMNKICDSLAGLGYEVTLVGRRLKTSPQLLQRRYRQERLRCFFNKGKLFYLEYNLRLFFFILFKNADIYSAADLDTILPCLWAAKLKGKPLAYDAHEYFTEVPEVVNRPFVKKIWKFIERYAVPKAKRCYTVSRSFADLFEKQYSRKFEVILNVPVLQPLKEEQPQEDKFILYQGALNKGRGLEQLIAAMQYIPMQLVIAGEGDLSNELRKLADKLGLNERVRFLGRVAPEKLRELTPKAFLGFNLLEDLGLSYYYSLANKFFDYMHALIPSISNDFPEYKRINDEHEVALLTKLEPEMILEALNKLLQDEGLYTKLKENCRAARLVYNWQAQEQKLAAIYREL